MNKEVQNATTVETRYGHLVHIALGILQPLEASKALVGHHMRRSPVSYDVEMFVVQDVSQPGQVQAWCSALRGSEIASVTFFTGYVHPGGALGTRPVAQVTHSNSKFFL